MKVGDRKRRVGRRGESKAAMIGRRGWGGAAKRVGRGEKRVNGTLNVPA